MSWTDWIWRNKIYEINMFLINLTRTLLICGRSIHNHNYPFSLLHQFGHKSLYSPLNLQPSFVPNQVSHSQAAHTSWFLKFSGLRLRPPRGRSISFQILDVVSYRSWSAVASWIEFGHMGLPLIRISSQYLWIETASNDDKPCFFQNNICCPRRLPYSSKSYLALRSLQVFNETTLVLCGSTHKCNVFFPTNVAFFNISTCFICYNIKKKWIPLLQGRHYM